MAASAQGTLKLTKAVKQSGIGVPGSTGSQYVRRTSSVFALARDSYDANEIVSHQQDTGATAGAKKTTGKLDGLLSAGTWANMLGSLLRANFAAVTAITAASITIAGSGPTYTVTRAAGSFLTDGLKIGDIIRLSVGGFNAANLSKNLIITALSPTVATVYPLNGVALVAEGPIATSTVTVIGKKSKVPTSGHTNDYWSVEELYSDRVLSDLFTDVKIGKADITIPPNANATISFDMPGLGRTTGSAEVLTTPSAATTTAVLNGASGFILVNSVLTPVTGLQLSIDGQIKPGDPEVGSNNVSDHIRGPINVSGSFSAKFTAQTIQAIYDAQTIINLVGVAVDGLAAAADFVSFNMSAVKVFSDTPDDGEAKEITRTYSFTAQINSAGGAALASDQTIISIQDSQAP